MNKNNNEAIKIFENPEFGKVRIIEEDGKPLFCGKDVAELLGYANTKDAILKHCENDGVAFYDLADSMGRFQSTKFLTEGNVYRLIIHSKLPSAGRFEHWVFDEVLPSIRKHGAYMTPETIEKVLLNPDTIISLATALKEEQQKTAKLTAENAELKPKAAFADTVSNSTGALNMSQMAKLLHNKHIDMGRNRLMNFLRNEKILMQDNLPYQQYIERGYFKVIESVVGNEQYPMTKTSTLVLPAGQQFIFNLLEKWGEISA